MTLRHRTFLTLGAIGLLAAFLPATASAATAELAADFDDRSQTTTDLLVYIAGPGERNRVTIRDDGRDALLITDSVGITPGRGCTTVTPTRVRCARLSGSDAFGGGRVLLGDGDDTVDAATSPVVVPELRGGPGNDVLTGDPEHGNHFIGGAGNDRMVGGKSSDFFDEQGAANGSDTFVGGGDLVAVNGPGGGGDSVSYSDRRGKVSANLDGRRNDGQRGENDQIGADVEAIVGGRGNDRLTGNGRANFLAGQGGSDRLKGAGGNDVLHAGSEFSVGRARTKDKLYGGSGNDELTGSRGRNRLDGGSGNDELDGDRGADVIRAGRGRDRVSGGSGADRISTRDRRRDRVNCGSGRDRLRADRADRRRRCERVRLG